VDAGIMLIYVWPTVVLYHTVSQIVNLFAIFSYCLLQF